MAATRILSNTASSALLRQSLKGRLNVQSFNGGISLAGPWNSSVKDSPRSLLGSLKSSYVGGAVHVRPSAAIPRRRISSSSVFSASYTSKESGTSETLEYRIFFQDKNGKTISPWHDIPLNAGNGLVHMVCEIPRETNAKMEVATDEPNTPIKQDTKKGKLRYYPYNINWNYGLFPQTWEDPNHTNPEVDNAGGDNDPVDAVDISPTTAKMGEVYAVKPLGVLAMVDEGELDWKVIVIRADDPKASLVNDVDDVDKHFPGTLTAVRDWFRDYKIPDGKPPNNFGLGNKAAGKDVAMKVLAETNVFWSELVKRSVPAGELSLV